MRLQTVLITLGAGAILYFFARLINLYILKREDKNCPNSLFHRALYILMFIFGFFSLPVSLPIGFLDTAYAARITKKHDHDMATAHLKYVFKCENCPGKEHAPQKPFGYDSEHQRWTDDSY